MRLSETVGPAVLKVQPGYEGNALNVNSQAAAYTTVASDAGGIILHPSTDNNPQTFTIDSNANVPYPIGTKIEFFNEANTLSIAITADAMTLAGGTSTGTRSLAAYGVAVATKTHATAWVIYGTNLT